MWRAATSIAMVTAALVAACSRAPSAPPASAEAAAAAPAVAVAAKPASPTGTVGGPAPQPAACEPLRITITASALVLAGPTQRELPRTAAWQAVLAELRQALAPLMAPCSSNAVVISVEDAALAYELLIDVMDAAMAAGFTDVLLSGPPGDDQAKPPAPTPPTPTPPVPTSAPPAPRPLPPAAARPDLSRVPIVAITPSGVTVNGKQLHLTDGHLADAITKVLLELAPNAAPPGTLVIQADRDVPAATVTEVIRGAERAGFTNVLFAVKSKP